MTHNFVTTKSLGKYNSGTKGTCRRAYARVFRPALFLRFCLRFSLCKSLAFPLCWDYLAFFFHQTLRLTRAPFGDEKGNFHKWSYFQSKGLLILVNCHCFKVRKHDRIKFEKNIETEIMKNLKKLGKREKNMSLLGIEPGSPGTESRVLTITPQTWLVRIGI